MRKEENLRERHAASRHIEQGRSRLPCHKVHPIIGVMNVRGARAAGPRAVERHANRDAVDPRGGVNGVIHSVVVWAEKRKNVLE